MLLLRLVTIALCAACVVLLASFQPVRIAVMPPAAAPTAPAGCRSDRVPPLTVVDVAAIVTREQLSDQLHLRPYERITAVNDHPLARDLPVGSLIARLGPRPGEFLDLTVSTEWTERRVLVLLH